MVLFWSIVLHLGVLGTESSWWREDLTYFVDVDFRVDAPGHRKSISPHVTKQVRLPQGNAVIFPLKKHYYKINFSFEGVLVGETTREVEFDLPDRS
jgi:hypothetical protein